jgi:hypothetical protein
MAAVKSTRAMTASTDGSDAGAAFNVDTVNGIVSIPNGGVLNFYSDAYQTLTAQYGANGKAPIISATSPDPGAGGTIATTGLNVSLVTPASARTGCILQAGTFNGQEITVVNQSASNSITMAASGTSNVADGTSDVIAALKAALFRWVGGTTNLWYRIG